MARKGNAIESLNIVDPNSPRSKQHRVDAFASERKAKLAENRANIGKKAATQARFAEARAKMQQEWHQPKPAPAAEAASKTGRMGQIGSHVGANRGKYAIAGAGVAAAGGAIGYAKRKHSPSSHKFDSQHAFIRGNSR